MTIPQQKHSFLSTINNPNDNTLTNIDSLSSFFKTSFPFTPIALIPARVVYVPAHQTFPIFRARRKLLLQPIAFFTTSPPLIVHKRTLLAQPLLLLTFSHLLRTPILTRLTFTIKGHFRISDHHILEEGQFIFDDR